MMSTSRTIVVGYDGSPASRSALAWARERAGDAGRVIVVHAYHPPPEWEGTPYYQGALSDHQAHGKELLDAVDTAGTPLIATDLLEGRAPGAIARAEAHHADEIVVGSRGHGRIRSTLGSVAQGVLHEADRPVMVIPAG